MTKNHKDCKCDKCKSACKNKPGWFKPGESEKVAEFLNISLKELFDTKLMIDWWVGMDDVFIIAPGIKNGSLGAEYPANPKGECIFFTNGLCEIHEAKPAECRELLCSGSDKKMHEKVKNFWDKKQHQSQIENLLGRKPEAEKYEFMESFLW